MLSDVVNNRKAFTAQKFIFAVVAMLAMGLQKTDY